MKGVSACWTVLGNDTFYSIIFCIRGWQPFSVKSLIVNILGFPGQEVKFGWIFCRCLYNHLQCCHGHTEKPFLVRAQGPLFCIPSKSKRLRNQRVVFHSSKHFCSSNPPTPQSSVLPTDSKAITHRSLGYLISGTYVSTFGGHERYWWGGYRFPGCRYTHSARGEPWNPQDMSALACAVIQETLEGMDPTLGSCLSSCVD